jgi:hypothetical protein
MSQRKRQIYWSNLWNRFGCLPLLAAIAFGSLSLLILGITLIRQIESMQMARASKMWPSTEGIIVESGVASYRLTRKSSQLSYRCYVEYRYAVGGQEFTDDRLYFGDGEFFDTEQEARAVLGALRPGDAVTVYYDPDNPSNAVLRRTYSLQMSDYSIYLICLGSGVVAALLLYATYRMLIADPKSTIRKSRLPP